MSCLYDAIVQDTKHPQLIYEAWSTPGTWLTWHAMTHNHTKAMVEAKLLKLLQGSPGVAEASWWELSFSTCSALCQLPGLLFWCRKRLCRDGYGVDGTISGGTSMATWKLFF